MSGAAMWRPTVTLSKTERLVVYTAIAGGGRDALIDPIPAPGVDYVCFTDQPFTSRLWDIRPFKFIHPTEAVRTAKHPKVLPHEYFPDYDLSLWIDGNITPGPDIGRVARKYLAQHDMALHRHPKRNCLYKEAALVAFQGNDVPFLIEQVIQRYFSDGLPPNNGLYECGVLFRRHHSPVIKAPMELWWQEIDTGTQSDQIPWAYVMWKTGLRVKVIDSDLRGSPHWKFSPHECIFWGKVKQCS